MARNPLAWNPNPVPVNPLDARMTPAEAWAYNWPAVRQNFADAAAAAQSPEFWVDAARAYGQAMLGGSVAPEMKGIPVFHASWDRFEKPDFSRLGETTAPNVTGMSNEDWAMNLAKSGFWTSRLPVDIGAPHSLPFVLMGNVKNFSSLDQLEAAVRKAGGPLSFRQKMIEQGFSHGAVKDEEFGGRSYVTFDPEAITFGNSPKD